MKTITQKVQFKASPKELYGIFLDSKKHSLATGAKAAVSAKVGGPFKAWDGHLWGKNLVLVPGRMIVQSWRSTSFKKEDSDSVLILTFDKIGSGTLLTMVHAVVPDHDAEGITKGWHQFYWVPMKKYLGEK
jgi:activator of HSP90 ATPase